MATDTEIREAFHIRLGPALADVTISPSMLSQVRRRHRRERRVVGIAAPLAVAVLVAGAVVGVAAVNGASGGNETPPVGAHAHPPTILGHPFRLPSGWTRQPDGPPGPEGRGGAHGYVQEWGAMSGDAQQSVELMAQSRSIVRRDERLGSHATSISVAGLAGQIRVSSRLNRAPVEAIMTFTNGDLLDIEAQGMTAAQLERFLDAAVR